MQGVVEMATATSTELTEAQWSYIQPLLPPKAKTGRPRVEDRKTINGILWVLRTGARWADLPERYGASSTCHERLQTWQQKGIWEKLWRELIATMDEQEKPDWSKAFLDGAFIPAKRGERQ